MKDLPGKFKKAILTVATVIFWIAVWQIAAIAAGNNLILPGPAVTFRRTLHLAQTSAFWTSVGRSCLRIITGTFAGLIAGVLLSLFTHFVKAAGTLLRPMVTVIRTVPVASFIILAMLWVGKDLIPSLISFLMVFPIVYTSVASGLSEISPHHLKLIPAFGLNFFRAMKLIYLPSVKPYILSSSRTSFGLSWKAGIAAEVLAFTPGSIGMKLAESKNYLETVDLFAWTLTVVLISLLVEFILSVSFEKKKTAGFGVSGTSFDRTEDRT